MRRSIPAVALAAAVALSGVSVTAGPALAKPAASKPAKPAKVAFAANGSVTAVDVDNATVTVAVKGGTKDVKGRTVSISVPSTTRIVVNGTGRTLSAITAGYRITVTGSHVGSVYTAAKIQAHGKPARPAPVETDDPATPDDSDPAPAAQ